MGQRRPLFDAQEQTESVLVSQLPPLSCNSLHCATHEQLTIALVEMCGEVVMAGMHMHEGSVQEAFNKELLLAGVLTAWKNTLKDAVGAGAVNGDTSAFHLIPDRLTPADDDSEDATMRQRFFKKVSCTKLHWVVQASALLGRGNDVPCIDADYAGRLIAKGCV